MGPTDDQFSAGDISSLLEHLPVVTYRELVDPNAYPDSSIVYMSPQIKDQTGYPLDAYRDTPNLFFDVIMHPDDREEVLVESRRTIETGEVYRQEYRMIHKDGHIVWALDVSRLVREDEAGRQVWDGVTIDITERKQVELQLEESISLLRTTDRVRRELLSELVRAEESERARIAADLHDDSVQTLTAVALRLDVLGTKLKHDDDAEQLADVERISEMLGESVDRLRRLMFELRPHVLDEAGLSAALEVILTQMAEDTGITTNVIDQLTGEPATDLRAILFRVTRECLANVRKHARATRVDVELASTEHGTRVRVRDDGRGFDPSDLARPDPGHLGFHSMRERLESAGGRMVVTSSAGRGTTVELWVPSEDPNAR